MKRILLVEDELESRLVIQLMLQLLDCEVDCAFDGCAGVEMAHDYSYDCILMDIGLPKLDGISACKAIKAQQIRDHSFKTPIVAMTELNQIKVLDSYIEAGMLAILFKPLKLGSLKKLIKSLPVHDK